jgi:RNA polymerase sigma-70 factor (ECF subfamily)
MNAPDLRSELERLHSGSFGWALACCQHRMEEAEDVLHMAYVKVLEGKARFDGRASFRTWFFGVIRHTAIEQRRRRWVREALLLHWFGAQSSPAALAAPQQLPSDNDSLRNALGRLPQRQQQVLHLVFYQDLTVDEAATAMGVSPGTARTHFDRGKRKLRQLLAPERGEAR